MNNNTHNNIATAITGKVNLTKKGLCAQDSTGGKTQVDVGWFVGRCDEVNSPREKVPEPRERERTILTPAANAGNRTIG